MSNIWLQANMPMVTVHFQGGRMDGQSREAVRSRVSEGHELVMMGQRYRCDYVGRRWVAVFVGDSSEALPEGVREQQIGRTKVVMDRQGIIQEVLKRPDSEWGRG